MTRASARIAGTFAASLLAGMALTPADAQDLPVDLELVLAVDVSGSVDEVEAEQQRVGYTAALGDPTVAAAIAANRHGRIAVAYVEWAGADMQRTIVDWTLVEDAASAKLLADALAEAPRQQSVWTSISGAIDYAVPLFEGNGFAGTRQVIDVSGDGPNNRGRPVTAARDEAVARGIVINGLPIMNDRTQPWTLPTPNEFGLDAYYIDNVIGGPGAFIVAAPSFAEFKTAILSKLIREIAADEVTPGDVLADARR